MRILHILNHTYRLNGHVHAAVDLAWGQSELGHDVAIASSGGDFDALLISKSIEVINISLSREPSSILRSVVMLHRILGRFDIVHAHMMTSAILAWPACKIRRVPLVTTVHNEFERSAIAMSLGNRVIAVSGAVASSMNRRGVPESKLRTVLNGTIGSPRQLADEEPARQFDQPSILFVGGLHPRKGVADLIRAFVIVKKKIPESVLHLVGEGPYEEQYKQLANVLGVATAVKFHGAQKNPRPFLRGADVFVLPSLAEPAGLVLSEACEAGCAIVATDVGGNAEMLDNGRAGILVKPEDPVALAEAVVSLLISDSAREAARDAAKANVPRMSLSRVVRDTVDVYNECLS